MNNGKYHREDLTGQQFGWWTVGERQPVGSSHSGVVYKCRCKCGTEKLVSASVLHQGVSTSCGCRRKQRMDLTSKRFGKLVVVERTKAPPHYKSKNAQYWLCRCDCGNTLIATTGNLNFYPRSQSGGCKACSPRRNKYRLEKHKSTPEFRLWEKAKSRAKKRGILFNISPDDIIIPEVCPLLDIKLTHKKHGWDGNTPSLDRKNPSSGYVKSNVWVVSFRANLLKNNASRKELERLIERMKAHGID